ncbi:MAG: hypothetical protein WB709_03915 [Solirubrobacteraceae bacterium]
MNDRIADLARVRRGTLVAVLAIAVPLAALGAMTSSALATPKGEFAKFAQCPLSNPELSGCIIASTESGEFTIGKKTVPIKNVITLQGGFIENRETGAQEFVGAADGNTLSKTPQTVPGGLLGIEAPKSWPKELQELFNEFINKGFTGVTATTELAAPASSIGLNEENLLTAKGIALSLPLKIKLDNVFLGSECYIGSNSSPVVVGFTTGTTSPPPPNKPITGNVGTLGSEGGGAILVISKNSLVNNSFAAPAVTGCGGFFSGLVDPLVDSILGLPAAAGHNTAILNGTLKQAGAESVRESE